MAYAQHGREPPPLENEPPDTISTAEVGRVIDDKVMEEWQQKLDQFYHENFSQQTQTKPPGT